MIPLFIFVFSGRGGARREDGFGEGITAIPRILEKEIFDSGFRSFFLSTLVTRIVEVLQIVVMG